MRICKSDDICKVPLPCNITHSHLHNGIRLGLGCCILPIALAFCSSIRQGFISFVVHTHPSFPLPRPVSPDQRLSPAAGGTWQSPCGRTEVLGNSHPPRSSLQPIADGSWRISNPSPSPCRGSNLASVYTCSQQALSPVPQWSLH